MSEEKELTIEEMKSLVSLVNLLPPLLDKIAQINHDVAELKKSFLDIKTKYNENTILIGKYKESVDTLLTKQVDSSLVNAQLDQIRKELANINSLLKNKSDNKIKKDKSPEVNSIKKAKFNAEDDNISDEALFIVGSILTHRNGQKIRILTDIDIKKGFKADDKTTKEVIEWFINHKMYDKKTHTLTFPKR